MKTPRLVWDSKNEPPTEKPESAYERSRIVAADPNDAELPPDAVYLVAEKWSGTDSMGADQWKKMAGPVAPPVTMVRALARLADLETARAVETVTPALPPALDEDYLATEEKCIATMRDYFRSVAMGEKYEGGPIDAFRMTSVLSDAAWAASRRQWNRDHPAAAKLLAEAALPVDGEETPAAKPTTAEIAEAGLDLALSGALTAEPVAEPTAHLESDERTDDDMAF